MSLEAAKYQDEVRTSKHAGAPTSLILYPQHNDPCPVAALLKYLLVRGDEDGPLFNGRASDLAIMGATPLTIKQAGRWRSDAYLKYIRLGQIAFPSI